MEIHCLPLPDRVRESCRRVAEGSRFVRVVTERIADYANSLPLFSSVPSDHDPASHFLGHGEDTVAFFLTLDSVNFGSGYFPWLRKKPGMSGYFTVASSLTERFRTRGAFSAAELAASSADGISELFGQDCGEPRVSELLELFAAALRQLGEFVARRFGGDFTAVVTSCNGSAVRLAETLAELSFFRDVERYRGAEVHFYKRAQILPQDLALAFGGRGYGAFHDLDSLTIFADNLVPHVLRWDGILSYDPELARRIDAEEPIPSGSEEEIEIRACAVHAVELMTASLRAAGKRIAPREIDFLLWNRGQSPAYKEGKPRHRTRTVFY